MSNNLERLNQLPLLDWETHLHDKWKGNLTAATTLLSQFEKELHEIQPVLIQDFQNKDWVALRGILHTLKGSTSLCIVPRLEEIRAQVHQAVKTEKLPKNLFQNFLLVLDDTEQAIKIFFSQNKS